MVSRDRGQLLLVTAVAMAFIILGLAVLINTAVTTDVRAPDDPAVDVTEADRLAGDIDRGMAGMVARVNLDSLGKNKEDFRTEVDDNVSTYSDFLFEAVGDRRGALVDTGIEDIRFGTLVVDDDRTSQMTLRDENTLTGILLGEVSVRIEPEDPAPIRGLQLSFTTESFENGNDEPGVIIYGSDGCTIIVVDYDSPTQTFIVTAFDDAECLVGGEIQSRGDPGPTQECGATNGSIEINLGHREPSKSDCYLNAFANRTPRAGDDKYGLAINNADENEGGYRFIVGAEDFVGVEEGEPDSTDAYYTHEEGDSPYAARLVWSVSVHITQEARASERHATETVLVYDYPENAAVLEVDWVDD